MSMIMKEYVFICLQTMDEMDEAELLKLFLQLVFLGRIMTVSEGSEGGEGRSFEQDQDLVSAEAVSLYRKLNCVEHFKAY